MNERTFASRALLAALALLVALPAPAAAGLGPLAPANLSPQHLFLLEPPLEPPAVVERRAIRVSVDYATVFFPVKYSDPTQADLDMEIARFLLSYAQTLPGRIEARLDLPLFWMGGGVADGLVNGFHDTFHISTGKRDSAPMNEYRYNISSRGDTYSPEAGAGIGDLVLRFKREVPLGLHPELRAAARASVKLPTGSPSRGFGSGKADAAGGLVAAFGPRSWSVFGALDGVYVGGTPDSVLPLGTHWALKASVGAGIGLWTLGELTAQFEYFTTPYDTGERNLDRDVGMITLGFQRETASGARWSFGVTEDLISRGSPDFSVFVHAELPF